MIFKKKEEKTMTQNIIEQDGLYINQLRDEIERLNKEKDDLDDYNRHLHNENKRLNNIIIELEKWCDIQFQVYKDLDKVQDSRISCQYLRMKDKLKELKEGKE